MASTSARLDKLLVDLGLAPSRERAQALILAGKVLVDGEKITKAGRLVSSGGAITLTGADLPYVSRGGLKLEHALEAFAISVEGRVAMDVGASTGGFTDCLLQRGAARVYAVDVGYGQLAWSLRQDPRVVVIERQNIRSLPADRIPEPIQVATVDTSFISLRLVLPAAVPFLADGATLVALVKPQFEAGRLHVGKGGVVRDPAVHDEVCRAAVDLAESLGCVVLGVTPSPILGPKGNREFLLAAIRHRSPARVDSP
ncbi:MAG: TlyA family RNA methyltransferase [Syntrophobacteraceae bacterium]|nr:TlyA family RNA methyltransferase [Syntrophobacteraceae bacterium]